MRSDGNFRIHLFLGLTTVFFGLIFYRLFVLSYLKHPFYARTAEAQMEHINNVLARGNIYFSGPSGTPVLAATNKKFATLGVVSSKVAPGEVEELVQSISTATDIDEATIEKAVRSGSSNVKVIARRLENGKLDQVRNINSKAISLTYEMDRYYPHEDVASDVLGFLGYDGNSRAGQYGIEASFNQELFGNEEEKNSASIFGNWFGGGSSKAQIITRPGDVILTIDLTVQKFIEEQLDALMKKWSAIGGTVIVQDPQSGKIIAMADRPSFNPNAYSWSEPRNFLNSNVQEIFEPGSSFKPITMAAGLDLGKITPETTYNDTGSVVIDSYTIKNFSDSVFGRVTMSQVLEKSINTGTMHVENLVGDSNFTNYVINMGFGQQTGIDLPGEVNGDVANLYSGRKVNHMTASFGQGIAVTPLQLINAYSAIANGGKLMKPYIVQKIVKEGGQEIMTKPEIIGIPITEKTSERLTRMLVNVVRNGFDKARIPGYDIAGKTGTAQIPDGKGKYLEDQYIHNFVGFAPALNPQFTILIKIDKPRGITFAADSLSPTFKEIAGFMLKHYNIPPQN